MVDRLKGMVGLAVKAGRAVSGAVAVESAVKRGKAKLVLVDARASANAAKVYETMCRSRAVDCILLEDAGVLEELLGRDNRTALAITDARFAEAVLEILRKE